jgi:hypothetical protein
MQLTCQSTSCSVGSVIEIASKPCPTGRSGVSPWAASRSRRCSSRGPRIAANRQARGVLSGSRHDARQSPSKRGEGWSRSSIYLLTYNALPPTIRKRESLPRSRGDEESDFSSNPGGEAHEDACRYDAWRQDSWRCTADERGLQWFRPGGRRHVMKTSRCLLRAKLSAWEQVPPVRGSLRLPSLSFAARAWSASASARSASGSVVWPSCLSSGWSA